MSQPIQRAARSLPEPGIEEICSTEGCILPSVKTLNFTLSENMLFLSSPYLICFRSDQKYFRFGVFFFFNISIF